MNDRIPDPIEIMKACCERWAYDHIIKGDKFLCSCGKWCDLNDSSPSSSSPYALPICRDCCEKMVDELKIQKEK